MGMELGYNGEIMGISCWLVEQNSNRWYHSIGIRKYQWFDNQHFDPD